MYLSLYVGLFFFVLSLWAFIDLDPSEAKKTPLRPPETLKNPQNPQNLQNPQSPSSEDDRLFPSSSLDDSDVLVDSSSAMEDVSSSSASSELEHSSVWNHAILIDAGSSGSRVHVYEFAGPLGPGGTGLPRVRPASVHEAWTMKIEPGVSSFGDHPQDLAEYLLPLLQFALDTVKTEAASETPLFLMATAGLRLLDEDARALITSKLCEAIALFPFKFACENVKVISGEMEGVYGWVSANYLMNTLTKASSGSSGPETLGFMDLGGASTQITFEVKPESHRTGGILLNLSLDKSSKDHEYHLYSASHLGFGANEARKRYIHTQVANPNFVSAPHAILDPCLPRGKTFDFPFSPSEFPDFQSQFREYVEERVRKLGTPPPPPPRKEESPEPLEVLASHGNSEVLASHGNSEALAGQESETVGQDPDPEAVEPPPQQQQQSQTAELEQQLAEGPHRGEVGEEGQLPFTETQQEPLEEERPDVPPNAEKEAQAPEILAIEEPHAVAAARLPEEPEMTQQQFSAQIGEILPLPNENALVVEETLPTNPRAGSREESGPLASTNESRRQLLSVSEPGEEVDDNTSKAPSLAVAEQDGGEETQAVGTSEKRAREANEEDEDLSPAEKSPEPKTDPTVITLEGSGNFLACLEEIEEHDLLMRDLPCEYPPCSVNGAHQPEIDHVQLRFVAISEFWYTLYDVHGMHQYDYQEFERASEDFCAIPWATLMNDHEQNKFPHANLQRLEGQCFKAAWLVSLLHKGFGFPLPKAEPGLGHHEATTPRVPIFTKEVNGTEISWTLGALLIELTDGMNLHPNRPPQYFKEGAPPKPSLASPQQQRRPPLQPSVHHKPDIQVDAENIGNALSLSDWTAAGQTHELGRKLRAKGAKPWTMGEVVFSYFWACACLTLALEVVLWLNERRTRLLRGGGLDQHRSGRLHLEARVYKEV